ncbi:receptor-type tyrosine-protein phosphatase delta-like [Amphiura filiformis]|uniref:receptor-type tyrosine-protein phosphatase delta-like n=1 Tax=Amphiura filiformis TaxID=82378 RepID=UPI003B2140B8
MIVSKLATVHQECEAGKFGQRCDTVCHCAEGSSCHFYTGKCEGNCEPGWTGDYCENYVGLEALENCNTSVGELSVQSQTINSLTIHWQPTINACTDLTYNVKAYMASLDQCDSESVEFITPQQSNTTSTTMTVSNLKPYSTYVIYVKGVAADEKVGQEQFILAKTNQQEPNGTPTDVKVKSVNSDSITFDWDQPSCGQRHGEIISYTYTLTDSSNQVLQTGSTEDDAITFTGLESSAQYSFMVAADTSVGTGPYSELLQQDTQACIDGRYGKYCNGTCHCALGDSMCDPETGVCVTGGCDVQWYGEACQEPGTVSNAISTIDSTDSNTIEISWDPIADYPCPGLNYMVEYELISKDQCQLEADLARIRLADDINQSSARLTDLEFYSTYLVYIRAVHPTGNGQSAKIFVQTGESVPTLPPTHVAIDYDTTDSVRFLWDMPSCGDRNGDVSSYAYRLVNPDGNTTEDSIQDNMIIFSDLQVNSVYRFSTAAVTSVGRGPFSAPIEHHTPQIECPVGRFGPLCDNTCHCDLGDSVCDPMTGMCTEGGCDLHWNGDTCQEPDEISSVTATIDSTDSNTIEINWDPIADYPCPGLNYMVEYELINKDQCKLENDQSRIRLADDINQSSARLTGLEFYSTYLVYIRAIHSAGNGQPLLSVAQTGETAPTSSPTNVNIYDETNSSVTFTWNAPACGDRGGEILSYLYHLISLNGTKGGSTQDNIVTFKDLPPTSYSFFVAASTSSGRGPFSQAVMYTSYLDNEEEKMQNKLEEIQCTGGNDIPSDVTATSITTQSIEFTWNPPPCLLEYQAKPINYTYKLTSLVANVNVSSGETEDTKVTFHHLEPSTTFMFLVASTSPSEEGLKFAEPLMANTLANEPETPSNSHVAMKNQESLFVTWDSNADSHSKYMINYAILDMPYNLNFSSDSMSDMIRSRRQTSSIDSIEGTGYLLTDLLPSTKYEIQVSSTNQDGQSSMPDVFTAYTEPADHTYMLVPDPPIVVGGMDSNDTSVDIILPEVQSRFHTGYQLAVHRCDTSLPPGRLEFDSYYESPTAYVTAEFSKAAQNLPHIFTIGDDQTYSGFYNAPLQPGFMYFIYFGLVSQLNDTEAGYSWSPAAKVKILETVQDDKTLVTPLNLTDCQGLISILPANSSFLNGLMSNQVADSRLWFIITLCVACVLFLILIFILAVWLIKYSARKSDEGYATELLPPTERRGTIGRRSGEYTVTLPRPVPHLGSESIRQAWQ